MTRYVYKILTRGEWREAEAAGVYAGSGDDRRDGFIHLSARGQVAATAARHFAGVADLFLLEIEAARLGDALAWEPSRGGEMFPHLYGTLDTSAVVAAEPFEPGADADDAQRQGNGPAQ